jgi:uncharacterized integral membrane protein
MMEERFFELTEKYLENELSTEEKKELNAFIEKDPKLKNELEEQAKVKEVLKKMSLKNPSKEIWDGYWLGIYNKIERGFAWIAVSVGVLILIIYGTIEAVNAFAKDSQMPGIIKFGMAAVVIGILVLLFSVLREKFYTHKKDKYKEVQR